MESEVKPEIFTFFSLSKHVILNVSGVLPIS